MASAVNETALVAYNALSEREGLVSWFLCEHTSSVLRLSI